MTGGRCGRKQDRGEIIGENREQVEGRIREILRAGSHDREGDEVCSIGEVVIEGR